MYLMDNIVDIAHMVRERGMIKHPIAGVFPAMDDVLQGCPRFLFDEQSIHTAVELTLGRPKIMRQAMQHLRIPYTKLWIEWPEAGRQKLRDTFSERDAIDSLDRPLPIRLGFLLETDEKGRKGTVTWAWNNHFIKKHEPPNICPISAFFDLDGDFAQDSQIAAFIKANLASLWKDKPIQLEALLSIWRTSVHAPNEWGVKYIKQTGSTGWVVQNFYADVYGEYIMVWACLLLLTSSRKIVDYSPVDMNKLNKIRRLSNKPLKLDHTIVSMHIGNDVRIHQQGVPLGFTRKSPRIHMVASYLNRRGDKHWIVQPYWRGSGEMISRHIKVKT
jgi:hypothetical protein